MPVSRSPLPHGRTARRLTWPHLPTTVREWIESRIGAAVVHAASQDSGFTPGFASVLTDDSGGKTFVKAASVQAQRPFADAYREEARKLQALEPLIDPPSSIPATRLLWSEEVDGWVVLGIEYVAGRAPARPWLPADLNEALDALETCADLLTPPPMELGAFIDDVADWPALWERIPSVMPDFPFSAQAHGLAVGFAECCGGETLVHTDIRDDNILLTADGNAVFCDWNWPTRGADWIDSVVLLIGPRGDGLDVESVIGERRLLRDVPAEHIDRLLALILGYFLFSATQPVPPSSPYLREGQRWQGEVIADWLAERRGWKS